VVVERPCVWFCKHARSVITRAQTMIRRGKAGNFRTDGPSERAGLVS
jgi:hypothetical protein